MNLGAGLQDGRLPGVRQLLRAGVPAGVDGQNDRRFPRFPEDLSGLPEVIKTVGTWINTGTILERKEGAITRSA